jgi:hypothetical protein
MSAKIAAARFKIRQNWPVFGFAAVFFSAPEIDRVILAGFVLGAAVALPLAACGRQPAMPVTGVHAPTGSHLSGCSP